MKNRSLFIIIMLLTLVFGLTACSKKTETKPEENKIRITAAIFPAYDWTRVILGENPADAELTLLVDNGVDLHSYQPSVEDILTIHNADLFIYTGGESDKWITEALESAEAGPAHVIKMLDAIGEAAKEEEYVEGMQQDHEHEHEHEHEEAEAEYDEHVWLSLTNAMTITDTIAKELAALDPGHADLYQANAAAYKEKLSDLDTAYRDTVGTATAKTLIFGDRFPFRYLTEDYGLDYYAAFSGCSAETEASFETISFIADKVDELKPGAVLTIDGSDKRVAETIVRNTKTGDHPILILNSMQSVSLEDVRKGVTYLSVMEENLDVLKKALETK